MAARKQWWIEQSIGGRWVPMLSAQGGKEYIRGYCNALDSFYPHPEYRVMYREGGEGAPQLYEIIKAKPVPTLA